MAEPRTPFVDAADTQHAPAVDARIVSLVPALTELVFALGLGERLVGRTEFCHAPEAARDVDSVGGTKKINYDKLAALAPTHALLNKEENTRAIADRLAEMGIAAVVTFPKRPEDNFDLYRLVGGLFGAQSEADSLARRLEAGLARVKMAMRGKNMRRVLYLIWKEPYMTVGNDTYIANSLELAHLRAVHPPGEPDAGLAPDQARYPQVEIGDPLLLSVDAVLFPDEPYAFKRSEIKAFAEAFGVPRDKLIALSGKTAGWYGAHAPEAMEELVTLRAKIDALG